MKLATRLYGIEPAGLVTAAQHAERLGYESVWRGDHVVMPEELPGAHPYRRDAPLRPESPLLDPLLVFAHVAAATTTLRLGLGVLILPLRNPFVLARSLVTLDHLSEGRVIAGLAAGWLEREFELVGVPFRRRGAITDESLQVLQALLTQRHPGARFEPAPVQRPYPPIVIGGESEAALRRAARFGDGWIGHLQPIDSLAEKIAAIARLRGERPPCEITVTVPADVGDAALHGLAELGVDRVLAEIGDVNQLDSTTTLIALERFMDHANSAGVRA